MTAFPQIVSRIGHPLPSAYRHLADLIVTILSEYPQQALWYFTSVVLGKSVEREQRGKQILDRVRQVSVPWLSYHMTFPTAESPQVPIAPPNNPAKLISNWLALTKEFVHLSDTEAKQAGEMDMKRSFPALYKLCPMPLILPLQDSLTVTMPPSSSSAEAKHQPFDAAAPTFHGE